MYENYWRLQRKPFEPMAHESDYYPSETHQGAMLKLRYVIENHRGAALLVGPPGAGKTMLVQQLRRQLPEGFAPFVHVVFPRMSPAELLTYLADELAAPSLGATPSTTPSVDQAVRRIDRFLADNSRQGKHTVLVVDEAQLLAETGALETLRLLLNFELEGRPNLTALLVGQSAVLPALSRMPSLDERFGVKTLLRALSTDETASYVNHRLRAAGASHPIFDAPALEAIHSLTQGLPRQINRLCDLALLIGYAEELPSISATHVESVCEELVTVTAD